MTNIISLEDRKWYRVSSLYSNKHKTIINTTATTLDVTKGSPWDLVCSLVTHKLVWPVVSLSAAAAAAAAAQINI
jgi:hypothetical protein